VRHDLIVKVDVNGQVFRRVVEQLASEALRSELVGLVGEHERRYAVTAVADVEGVVRHGHHPARDEIAISPVKRQLCPSGC